jgi:hypothetical protein
MNNLEAQFVRHLLLKKTKRIPFRGLSTMIIQFVILLWCGFIHVKILKWHVKKIRHFTFTRQRWSSTTFNSLLAFDMWTSNLHFTPISSYLFPCGNNSFTVYSLHSNVCLSVCLSVWSPQTTLSAFLSRRLSTIFHQLNAPLLLFIGRLFTIFPSINWAFSSVQSFHHLIGSPLFTG